MRGNTPNGLATHRSQTIWQSSRNALNAVAASRLSNSARYASVGLHPRLKTDHRFAIQEPRGRRHRLALGASLSLLSPPHTYAMIPYSSHGGEGSGMRGNTSNGLQRRRLLFVELRYTRAKWFDVLGFLITPWRSAIDNVGHFRTSSRH